MVLHQVERYWKTRVELVSMLMEGAISSSLAPPVVKTEQAQSVFVVDVEGVFFNEPREKVFAFASASMSSPIFPFFCYV